MSRRRGREIALQTLFQLDVVPTNDQESTMDMAISEQPQGEVTDDDLDFARSMVNGTRSNIAAIDKLLAENSKGWKVSRMANVDRNIARMAVYELKFAEEAIDTSIVINEAVLLAKAYGTDDSSRFINGLLGSISRK